MSALAEAGARPADSRKSFLLRLIPAIAVLLTAAVYIQVAGFQFVYVDKPQIVDTQFFRSWHSIPRMFLQHSWAHIKLNSTGTYYRPVFLLWLFVNTQLFDTNDPLFWHLSTLFLHLVSTWLVYAIGRRLLNSPIAAGIAALLFGLHPAHIEAVAFVSGVTEPLMTAFFAASFLFYLKYRERESRLIFALSLACFAIAIFSKETAAVLPLIVLAYEWLFGHDRKSAFKASLPFFAVALFYAMARSIALKGIAPVITPVPLSQWLLTIPGLLWFYVCHLVWPARLAIVYNFALVSSAGPDRFVLPLAAIAMVAAGMWIASRYSRLAAFCGVWIVLTLLPALNLRAFLPNDLVHDRYLYLPSVALCILLAFGLSKLPKAGMGIAAVLILVSAAACWVQTRPWADDLSLFRRALEISPGHPVATLQTGTSLLLAGRALDAEPYLEAAAAQAPEDFQRNMILGRCLRTLQDHRRALAYFQRAAELRPREAPAHLLIAVSELALSDLRSAEREARAAIKLAPDLPGYHPVLGTILQAEGNPAEALSELEGERRRFPEEFDSTLDTRIAILRNALSPHK